MNTMENPAESDSAELRIHPDPAFIQPFLINEANSPEGIEKPDQPTKTEGPERDPNNQRQDEAENEMPHHAGAEKEDWTQQHHTDKHTYVVDLLGHRAVGLGVNGHLISAITASLAMHSHSDRETRSLIG